MVRFKKRAVKCGVVSFNMDSRLPQFIKIVAGVPNQRVPELKEFKWRGTC